MSGMNRIFAAAFSGLVITSISPASAQWGGYGDMGHGFGYSGYGQGNCGFGECGGGDADAFVGAVAGMASGAFEAVGASPNEGDGASQPQNQAAFQKAPRSGRGGNCFQKQWDSSDGWVNVAIPCR